MTVRPLYPGEPVEGMIRRLNRAKPLAGYKRRQFFLPKAARRRSKSIAARVRLRKAAVPLPDSRLPWI
jgi:ribosomal protein S21